MILTLLKWIVAGILAIVLVLIVASLVVVIVGAVAGVFDYIKTIKEIIPGDNELQKGDDE